MINQERLRRLRAVAHAGFDEVGAGRFIEITDEAGEEAFWASVDADVDARLTAVMTDSRGAAPQA